MNDDNYKTMVRASQKKSKEDAELKYDRDQARKNYRTGRRHVRMGVNSEFAQGFIDGTLLKQVKKLEKLFGYRKQEGLTSLLR